jgi:ubiquinone/menaquinone biosynthesis C-methylase UbiE
VQTIYILEKYKPDHLIGVDLSEANIDIAQEQRGQNALRRVDFLVDDAQKLYHIKDCSIDIVINIESAFHYPDKASFVNQVYRVLRLNGCFLIADILNRSEGGVRAFRHWQRRMNLNHWTLADYRNAFLEAGLEINYQDDISRDILHGFHHSRIWSETFRKQNLLTAVLGYLWGKAMAGICSLHLLTFRRYHIFVGKKMVSS